MVNRRKRSRTRVPKLKFTTVRNVGWHVSFRDPKTGHSHRHRFGIVEREREKQALALYHAWVSERLGGNVDGKLATKIEPAPKRRPTGEALSGSLLEVASGLKESERLRIRKPDEPRRRGTIASPVFRDRAKIIRDFLEFLNARKGTGAVSRMRLADLTMDDVEAFNQHVVKTGFSDSQVAKRLQIVKAIIDRAGRPEHGRQMLMWNWDSRDVAHGKPTPERPLPTVDLLKKMLAGADLRGKTMIWLGIGLGLGAKDLAVVRVGQIDKDAYDLRRSKTGVERFGDTPLRVWACVSKYQDVAKRPAGGLLFVTRTGVPLVHAKGNAVTQWWDKLRTKVDESKETLPGFYTLRHLGATEFGSRPGTSISDVKRWLGHSSSSDMADVYMRPVRPEFRKLIEWVREQLSRDAVE